MYRYRTEDVLRLLGASNKDSETTNFSRRDIGAVVTLTGTTGSEAAKCYPVEGSQEQMQLPISWHLSRLLFFSEE